MRATTRTFTPTIVGLLSIIAMLLALLATGTAAGTEDSEPSDDTAECAVAATTDTEDCGEEKDAEEPEAEDVDLEFGDVEDGLPHAEGIAWLADEGLTNGCNAGKFCPNKPLKRGEFASFLYRYDASEAPSVEELLDRIEALEALVAEHHPTEPVTTE